MLLLLLPRRRLLGCRIADEIAAKSGETFGIINQRERSHINLSILRKYPPFQNYIFTHCTLSARCILIRKVPLLWPTGWGSGGPFAGGVCCQSAH